MSVRPWLAAAAVLGLLATVPTTLAQTSTKSTGRPTSKGSARSAATQKKAGASVDDAKSDEPKPKTELATFGGGCFWCIEAVFERVPGVKSAVSGYAGGDFPKPTYELVCTGETGHAEVVQVEYDPKAVTYEKLLEVFFSTHDPTTLNRQGPDFGTQYRSIILVHNDYQLKAATQFIQTLNREAIFGAPVVTEVVPLTRFFKAEAYHQDYFRKHPNQPYCQMYIPAKLEKLRHVEFPKFEPQKTEKPAEDTSKGSGPKAGSAKSETP
jgi:peptide-methionine (S)-S-oxide reductase